MAKSSSAPIQLRKGAKVVATVDLRDVPAGTEGRVMMVTGLTWTRYWVRFANGIQLGQISRDRLATPAELKAGTSGGSAPEAVAAEATADASGSDEGSAGVATPAGTLVPQKLLDRSAAARARLAA